MTKKKMYRYSGRNGILTTSILLDDIKHILVYELKASSGKILTNGEIFTYTIIVEEEELADWREIDDITDKTN